MKNHHLESGSIAEKKLEKGSAEWQFFQDFWRFRQKYHDPDGESNEWFVELARVGEDLINKYKDTDFSYFAQQMVFAHMGDIEYRERIINETQRMR